jgi:hypothetical protein
MVACDKDMHDFEEVAMITPQTIKKGIIWCAILVELVRPGAFCMMCNEGQESIVPPLGVPFSQGTGVPIGSEPPPQFEDFSPQGFGANAPDQLGGVAPIRSEPLTTRRESKLKAKRQAQIARNKAKSRSTPKPVMKSVSAASMTPEQRQILAGLDISLSLDQHYAQLLCNRLYEISTSGKDIAETVDCEEARHLIALSSQFSTRTEALRQTIVTLMLILEKDFKTLLGIDMIPW